MIEWGAATTEDLAFIATNMWLRGKREMMRFGYDGSPDEFADYVSQAAVEIYAFRDPSQEKPLAILGIIPTDTGYCTIFQAVEQFTDEGLEITKALRRFAKQWRKDNPQKEGAIYSASDHPDASRWFALLGFDPAPPGRALGKHIRCYLLR
jgi:hypothetical protein